MHEHSFDSTLGKLDTVLHHHFHHNRVQIYSKLISFRSTARYEHMDQQTYTHVFMYNINDFVHVKFNNIILSFIIPFAKFIKFRKYSIDVQTNILHTILNKAYVLWVNVLGCSWIKLIHLVAIDSYKQQLRCSGLFKI